MNLGLHDGICGEMGPPFFGANCRKLHEESGKKKGEIRYRIIINERFRTYNCVYSLRTR